VRLLLSEDIEKTMENWYGMMVKSMVSCNWMMENWTPLELDDGKILTGKPDI